MSATYSVYGTSSATPFFHFSTTEHGGSLNPPNSYPANIAPLASAAEDASTLFWPAASLTSFHSTDDTFGTSPSTLSWAPSGYPSKTSSTQFILFTSRNCLIDISTNAHLDCRPFPGLSVSQAAFDAPSYQEANHSRPIWDVNAHSSSLTDTVSRWTAPLLDGDYNSNHAPIPGCQSMNDSNVNLDFAFGPMSSLAPPLDYSVANSNFIAQSTGIEASSGTTFDTSLGYHPRPAIAEEMLSPNTLSTIGPDLLPGDNNYLPQTQAGSPDETFNSEMPPPNPDEHGWVESAHPNTCLECLESFEDFGLLFSHSITESHALFMCKCGKSFTRPDVLDRHVKGYLPELQKYTCPHCKSCPGGKSFKRKDHLTQHIRGYHHIGTEKYRQMHFYDYLCPHSDCPKYREPDFFDLPYETQRESRPFGNLKEFTQHMRTDHDDTPYPCDVRGCLRVRGKGYIRKVDLIKHRKREHPEVPKYKNLHSCRLPGCSASGEGNSGIRDHYEKEHGYSYSFAQSLAEWWS